MRRHRNICESILSDKVNIQSATIVWCCSLFAARYSFLALVSAVHFIDSTGVKRNGFDPSPTPVFLRKSSFHNNPEKRLCLAGLPETMFHVNFDNLMCLTTLWPTFYVTGISGVNLIRFVLWRSAQKKSKHWALKANSLAGRRSICLRDWAILKSERFGGPEVKKPLKSLD